MDKGILNKLMHATLLCILKYIPMLIALVYMINMMSEILCLDIVRTQNILGISIYSWGFMYVASLVFKFCFVHRVFLQYIGLVDIINFLEYYEIHTTSSYYNIKHFLVLFGVMSFINLLLYNNDRNNKKIIT